MPSSAASKPDEQNSVQDVVRKNNEHENGCLPAVDKHATRNGGAGVLSAKSQIKAEQNGAPIDEARAIPLTDQCGPKGNMDGVLSAKEAQQGVQNNSADSAGIDGEPIDTIAVAKHDWKTRPNLDGECCAFYYMP